jgi:capsular polysaccharide biosynthesis protein
MCLDSLQEMRVAQVLVALEPLVALVERTLFPRAHLVSMALISKARISVAELAVQREAKVLPVAAEVRVLHQLQQSTVKLLPSLVVQVVAEERAQVQMGQLIGMEHFSLTAPTSMDLQEQV